MSLINDRKKLLKIYNVSEKNTNLFPVQEKQNTIQLNQYLIDLKNKDLFANYRFEFDWSVLTSIKDTYQAVEWEIYLKNIDIRLLSNFHVEILTKISGIYTDYESSFILGKNIFFILESGSEQQTQNVTMKIFVLIRGFKLDGFDIVYPYLEAKPLINYDGKFLKSLSENSTNYTITYGGVGG